MVISESELLTYTASNKIDRIVMAEIHGRPPNPEGVENEQRSELREDVAHEERLQGCISRMQGGESTEHERGCGKGRCV